MASLRLGRLAFHPELVANALAALIAVAGITMLVPAVYALWASDGAALALGVPAVLAIVAGTGLFFLTRSPNTYVARQDVLNHYVTAMTIIAGLLLSLLVVEIGYEAPDWD